MNRHVHLFASAIRNLDTVSDVSVTEHVDGWAVRVDQYGTAFTFTAERDGEIQVTGQVDVEIFAALVNLVLRRASRGTVTLSRLLEVQRRWLSIG